MLIKFFEKHNFLSWLITLFGAGLIYYISSLSFSSSNIPNFYPPVYHFFSFLSLCAFLLISLHRGKWSKRKFILGIILVCIYSILDEFHQIFVSGRFFSYLDIFINFLGIFCASLIYYKRLR